jgi:two-component system, cell cycle sensor histidine kinase and response regulator CckA
VLRQSAERGGEMVKQVLSFARGVEGQKIAIQPTYFIKEILKVLRETLPKNITVKQSLPPDIGTVNGDATQLHQVLMNLCVNARDAMPDGGSLTIGAENTVIDEHYARMVPDANAGRYVMITVSDTGAGIPEHIKDKIFDPFFTTKEKGKGTGLGLSTVIGIVKSLGGFINVYSEVGKGAKFKIYLPMAETADAAETAATQTGLPLGNGELILVVDDEAGIRDIAKTTLETFGYRVLTAEDGAEAVAIYASRLGEVQAVLTDMMMPFLDGAATIRALQKLDPQVRIIASTGLSDGMRSEEAEKLGAKLVLSKPYTAETLLKALAASLDHGP